MIEGMQITGPLAALAAGIVTSLHCVGMCGPLACAACTSNCGRGSNLAAMLYHALRVISYTLIGGLVGALGGRISDGLVGGATRGMTWIFVLFFLAVVIGLDKRLRLPVGGAWLGGLFAKTKEMGPMGRAAALGLLTPLLPCAPLYLIVAAAALSGSAISGSVLMAAFGLGTVPLLFVVQNRLASLQQQLSPRTMDYIRRGLALTSVVLLLLRSTYSASTGCPLCH